MRSQVRTLAFVSMCTVGCKDNIIEIDPNYVPTFLAENCPKYNVDGGTPPDLATPPPKCAAAKGLAGDTLLCVDFKDLANQTLTATPPAELPGWKFDATNCLEIASGKLQVKNFGTFVGTCSFMMPLTDLASAVNQKYQSVTLAVAWRDQVVPFLDRASILASSICAARRNLDRRCCIDRRWWPAGRMQPPRFCRSTWNDPCFNGLDM